MSCALESLGIRKTHSHECLEEASYYLQNNRQNSGLDDPELLDLMHIPFVTIDHEQTGNFSGESTLDFAHNNKQEFSGDLTQALYVERDAQGYRVMCALADVSYYIKPASALFNEALQRGATIRTPVLTIPILPLELQADLISLSPHAPRRSLVFDIRLDHNATVLSCNFLRARICSTAKLSYGGMQQWLDSDSAETQSYHASLKSLRQVGATLIEAGRAQGAVYFNKTKAEVTVAGTPPRFIAATRERFDTEHYCEHIRLICDRQGAAALMGLEGVTDVLQAMFQVHELPLKKSLNTLKATLNEWANSDAQPEMWLWRDGQTWVQFLESLPKEKIHCRRVHAIERQIMKAHKSSTFSPEAGEHHALKTSSYIRFSAPLHDVVGIYAQGELLEALCGVRYDDDTNHTTRGVLKEKVINAANAAREQQRTLDKKIALAALHSFFKHEVEDNDAPWHVGTIVGIGSDKLYVSLDDESLDVKIYRSDLEATYATQYTSTYTHVIASNEDIPSWQLGQGVHIRLQRYDVATQRYVFWLQADSQTQ